ncbi:amino acid adenylation domain-containing protein [Pseudoalteromonas luteoviolacea]|uniref:non-ribosomal peptide synthetase n=1 Tax=Pseudoalteromonas luteoviolacea TaxID=43657 RepID=UPI001B37E8D8|nr:amino acid adenylation domain-containing protein [Pseudoalteromonas luteoviolacea]
MENVIGIIDSALEQGVLLYLDDDKLKFKAKSGALSEELRAQIKAHKDEIIVQLQAMANSHNETIAPIPIVDRNGAIPLSFSQQRLWFIDQMEKSSAHFNLTNVLRLEGQLDQRAFMTAIDRILQRHEVLRTRFVMAGDDVYQHICETYESPVKDVDLSALTPANQQAELEALIEQDTAHPFQLDQAPLLRAHLVKMSETVHVVVFNVHHIASDGWSTAILIKEFSQHYQAALDDIHALQPLEKPTVQYADYAAWQRNNAKQDEFKRDVDYWLSHLADAPKVHQLPLDFPRPARKGTQGNTYHYDLSKSLQSSLHALCKSQGVTLFMLLQSAFALLLARLSGEKDIVMGSPHAGRIHQDLEPLIGLFVNTLVLRNDLSHNQSFSTYLQNSKSTILEAYNHQQVPFETLVEKINPQRSLAFDPLVQVIFVLQNNEQASMSLPGLTMTQLNKDERIARDDLHVSVIESEDGLHMEWQYRTALFLPETIARFCQHFETLLTNIVNQPDMPIYDLEINSAAQLAHLHTWSCPEKIEAITHRADRCLHHHIEQQTALTPDNTAVIVDDQAWSYTQLNQRANQLAHYLISLGVKPDTTVAISMRRSTDMVVSLLAILKAGGAYVPIDPDYPTGRIQYMLEDSGAQWILTQKSLQSVLPTSGQMLISLDDSATQETLQGASQDNPVVDGLSPTNLAYIIYTSGSTGRPKGVLIEHHTVVDYLGHCEKAYFSRGLSGAVVSLSLSFDATVTPMWAPLMLGHHIELLSEQQPMLSQLPDYLCDDEEALLFKLTPAHLDALLVGEQLEVSTQAQHLIIIGGEALTTHTLKQWQALLPNCTFVNEYGPTEATVGASTFTIEPKQSLPSVNVPIGKPMANTQLYVVASHEQGQKDHLSLQPCGVAGELLIGGQGLARGYHGQPELSAERFIAHPFSDNTQDRLYKTGDLVRWLPDGNLEFLGRIDEQVKIRGFRIELGEIAAQLEASERVQEAVVLHREDSGQEKRLVAYVIPSEAHESDDRKALTQALQAALKEELPDYMVPNIIILMAQFPLSANGKVDKRALPAPEESDLNKSEYVAPRNHIEHTLCDIWQTVLGLKKVGIHDNFFAMGGDSIVSIQVVSRAKKANLHFKVKQLFEFQTVATLADYIQRNDLYTADTQLEAEQKPCQGALLLTPIQSAFFDLQLAQPNHYNQSVLMSTPEDFEAAHLSQLTRALYTQHDVFRLRFSNQQAAPSAAYFAEFEESMLAQSHELFDMSALTPSEAQARMQQNCHALQQQLDIVTGPVIKAALFKMPGGSNKLFVTIHHLVVDGVSWRVLFADLEYIWAQLSTNKPIKPRAKTTSYQTWSELLQTLASSQDVQDELPFWQQQLPPAQSERKTAQSTTSETLQAAAQLDSTRSMLLLGECNDAYRTTVNELLLAALMLAYKQFAQRNELSITLEGHGREGWFEHADVSDTVGWFTTLFPLRLAVANDDDNLVGDTIKAVKERYRTIPNKGVGYGLLRHSHKVDSLQLDGSSEPSVIFNYLGQIDAGIKEGGPFQIDENQPGNNISQQNRPMADLTLTGSVQNETLRFQIGGSQEHFNQQQLSLFAQQLEQCLIACVEHCLMLNTLKLKNEHSKTKNKKVVEELSI